MAIQLKKISNVILYGFNEGSKKLYKYFRSIGMNVPFVIDRNAATLTNEMPCEIISLEKLNWFFDETSLVVICLQNGLLHDEVAAELYKLGISQIVFLPTHREYKNQNKMLQVYEQLMEQDWDLNITIPGYTEMIEEKTNIIYEGQKYVTCWVDLEYIHSSMPVGNIYLDKYLDKNIVLLKPYYELYEYIQGNEEYPYEYLSSFRKDEKEKKKLLLDRVRLLDMYMERLNTHPEYFSLAAATAVWNEKGYFNITDGHHRVTFLALMKWYWIPLRITREDYLKYGVTIKEKSQFKYMQIFKEAYLLINQLNLKFNTILDCTNSDGYFGRLLKLHGGCKYYKEIEEGEKYDIAFFEGSKECFDKVLKVTDTIICKIDEMNTSVINKNGFVKKQCIYQGYVDGEFVHICLCLRGDNNE